jgi:GNAT superfamily N-acetyltransferase
MNVAYTIGAERSYDEDLATEDPAQNTKMGQREDDDGFYEGGWVWRTAEEAGTFIEQHKDDLLSNTKYAVYKLALPNDWNTDVNPEKGPDGVHLLINDALIVAKSASKSASLLLIKNASNRLGTDMRFYAGKMYSTPHADYKFPLTIWRVLRVPKDEELVLGNIGVHWTDWKENTNLFRNSGNLWDQEGEGANESNFNFYTLEAQILKPEDVDWEATIRQNQEEPMEHEVTVKDRVMLRLVSINGKPSKRMITAATVKPTVLYHGTSKDNLNAILKQGLKLRFSQQHEISPAIYLSDKPNTAKAYATLNSSNPDDASNWVILAINVRDLDEGHLQPDDAEFRGDWENDDLPPKIMEGYEDWTKVPWALSLKYCQQVRYMKNIPPNAIKVWKSASLLKKADERTKMRVWHSTDKKQPPKSGPVYFSEEYDDAAEYGKNVFSAEITPRKLLVIPSARTVRNDSSSLVKDLLYILQPALAGYGMPINPESLHTFVRHDGIYYPILKDYPEIIQRMRELRYDGTFVDEPIASNGQSILIIDQSVIKWGKEANLLKKADVPELQKTDVPTSKEYDAVRWVYQWYQDNQIPKLAWRDFQKQFQQMAQKYPKLWMEVRQNRPQITREDLDRWMDEAKPDQSNYNLQYSTYNDAETSYREAEQLVMQINQSASAADILAQDPTLQKYVDMVGQSSEMSGHPASKKTVGWLRVDFVDDDWLLVDEVQSDLVNSVSQAKLIVESENFDDFMASLANDKVRQMAAERGINSANFRQARARMLQEGYTLDKLEEIKTSLVQLFQDWAEYGIASLIDLARRHGIKNVAIHTAETIAQRDESVEADKIHIYYDNLARSFGFKKQQLDIGNLQGNFWARTAAKKPTNPEPEDADYSMVEGCGIYAVDFARANGGEIYILSNDSGEAWSEDIPYEVTHVFVNKDGKTFDVRGERSVDDMAQELQAVPYSIKGPWSVDEFKKKFMGNSDKKPLYGKGRGGGKVADTDILVEVNGGSAYGNVLLAEYLMYWLAKMYGLEAEAKKLLAKVSKHEKVAVLEGIEVEPEHRGQGLGVQLLRDFSSEAQKLGATVIVTMADTRGPQKPGFNLITWYKKQGFQQVGGVHPFPLLFAEITGAEKQAAAKYPQTDEWIGRAEEFLKEKWGDRRKEQGREASSDLHGACKFASLFAKVLFGGVIRGNVDHQLVKTATRIIDLTGMFDPNTFHHDKEFFGNPEHAKSMASCEPRVARWVKEFRQRYKEKKAALSPITQKKLLVENPKLYAEARSDPRQVSLYGPEHEQELQEIYAKPKNSFKESLLHDSEE